MDEGALFLANDPAVPLPPRDPIWFRLTCLASRLAPRGKAALPRAIARVVPDGAAFRTRVRRGFCLVGNATCIDALVALRNSGRWDDHVMEACLAFLAPGDRFFDVGANAGYMAVGCAVRFGDAIEVVAFEPQPALARAIVLSGRANGLGRLRVVNACLSDREGRATLYLSRHAIHASLVARETAARRLDVPAYTLDRLCESGALPSPDVIKLDVEGAEKAMLDGARRVLAAGRPTVVFECDANAGRFGYGLDDMLAAFRAAGYDLFLSVGEGGALTEIAAASDARALGAAATSDFVATTRQTVASRRVPVARLSPASGRG